MTASRHPPPDFRPLRRDRTFTGLIAAALLLRLAVVLWLPSQAWFDGGDGPWYVQQAWAMAHGTLDRPLQTVGPIFPLVLAAVWSLFPDHPQPIAPTDVAAAYLTVVRLLQVILGTATVALTFLLARRLTLHRTAALVAAASVAFHPAFVMEPSFVRSETIFMTLLVASLLGQAPRDANRPASPALIAGIAVAGAALTRPIALLLPALSAVLALAREGRQAGRRQAVAILAGAVLVLAPWHVWLYQGTGRWLPEGFAFNLMTGAQGDGRPLDRQQFDRVEEHLDRTGRTALEEATRAIVADPIGWTGRRARNVAWALAQPHGTSDLGGPSMKAALSAWWSHDRTVASLAALVTTPGFAIRGAIYAFHYSALVLALLGALVTRHRWKDWLAVHGTIVYMIGAYGVLVALPRYLFPIQPLLWVLAAAAVAWFLRSGTRARATASHDPAIERA